MTDYTLRGNRVTAIIPLITNNDYHECEMCRSPNPKQTYEYMYGHYYGFCSKECKEIQTYILQQQAKKQNKKLKFKKLRMKNK